MSETSIKTLEKNRALYYILYVVFRRQVRLILLCSASFALIVFFTYLTTPRYKALAKILVRPHPQQQLILFRDLATPGQGMVKQHPAANLILVLTSQEMAQQVVKEFSLDEKLRKMTQEPEELRIIIKQSLVKVIRSPITFIRSFRKVEKRPTDFFPKAVKKLMGKAHDIKLEKDTNVINLGIWEDTPGLASDIANRMAQLLMDKSTQLEQANTRQAVDFTKGQIEAAEKVLRESEDKLFKFLKKNKIIKLEEEKKAKLDELHRLESQYINVKAEHSETQAKLQEIRNTISAQKHLLSKAPIFSNNPVVKELMSSVNNTEIELAGALEKFTESSQQVKRLRAQISESRKKIQQELKVLMQSDSAILQSTNPDLANEYAHLKVSVAALVARRHALPIEIDGLREKGLSLSAMETELAALNRQKKTNEELYTKLLDKFSELEVQKTSQMSGYDLKVIDKAFLPDNARPTKPKWLFTLFMGLVGSFLLAFGIVFFIEYWDESFQSPDQIEDKVGLPVLCTVADMKRFV